MYFLFEILVTLCAGLTAGLAGEVEPLAVILMILGSHMDEITPTVLGSKVFIDAAIENAKAFGKSFDYSFLRTNPTGDEYLHSAAWKSMQEVFRSLQSASGIERRYYLNDKEEVLLFILAHLARSSAMNKNINGKWNLILSEGLRGRENDLISLDLKLKVLWSPASTVSRPRYADAYFGVMRSDKSGPFTLEDFMGRLVKNYPTIHQMIEYIQSKMTDDTKLLGLPQEFPPTKVVTPAPATLFAPPPSTSTSSPPSTIKTVPITEVGLDDIDMIEAAVKAFGKDIVNAEIKRRVSVVKTAEAVKITRDELIPCSSILNIPVVPVADLPFQHHQLFFQLITLFDSSSEAIEFVFEERKLKMDLAVSLPSDKLNALRNKSVEINESVIELGEQLKSDPSNLSLRTKHAELTKVALEYATFVNEANKRKPIVMGKKEFILPEKRYKFRCQPSHKDFVFTLLQQWRLYTKEEFPDFEKLDLSVSEDINIDSYIEEKFLVGSSIFVKSKALDMISSTKSLHNAPENKINALLKALLVLSPVIVKNKFDITSYPVFVQNCIGKHANIGTGLDEALKETNKLIVDSKLSLATKIFIDALIKIPLKYNEKLCEKFGVSNLANCDVQQQMALTHTVQKFAGEKLAEELMKMINGTFDFSVYILPEEKKKEIKFNDIFKESEAKKPSKLIQPEYVISDEMVEYWSANYGYSTIPKNYARMWHENQSIAKELCSYKLLTPSCSIFLDEIIMGKKFKDMLNLEEVLTYIFRLNSSRFDLSDATILSYLQRVCKNDIMTVVCKQLKGCTHIVRDSLTGREIREPDNFFDFISFDAACSSVSTPSSVLQKKGAKKQEKKTTISKPKPKAPAKKDEIKAPVQPKTGKAPATPKKAATSKAPAKAPAAPKKEAAKPEAPKTTKSYAKVAAEGASKPAPPTQRSSFPSTTSGGRKITFVSSKKAAGKPKATIPSGSYSLGGEIFTEQAVLDLIAEMARQAVLGINVEGVGRFGRSGLQRMLDTKGSYIRPLVEGSSKKPAAKK